VCNCSKHEGQKERRWKIATDKINVPQKARQMESEERIEWKGRNRKQQTNL
jgi:hypothetical protein